MVSHKPDAYQRPAIEQHKEEIISFLSSGEYKYFPEITLACRVKKYDEFARNIGIDNAVDRDDAQFVTGLKVLVENLPYGYRARHAYLKKNDNKDLVRVDGNHRLEFFDENYSDWWLSHDYNKKSIENLIVPYTIIFSEQEFGDKFEAGIFHNINFKQVPLRQEASLRIICDLDVFEDKEKLGKVYPLALKLIKIAETNTFDVIFWLKNNNNIDKEYYRTACLRIAQLLVNRKDKVQEELKKEEDKQKKINNDIEQTIMQLTHG